MELEQPVFAALYTYTKALSVALGYRDLSTRLHSERVLGLSETIGVGCGLSGTELGILRIAATFHDIGKIGIPDHILLKPSGLDEAEVAAIKEHSEIGQRIIAATELEGSEQVSLVIRQHHEHYNGLGYPDRLSGEEISICSRIISIADSYDAMAVTRSYQDGKAHLEVMDILHQETGGKHDPELMRIFFEIIESKKFKEAKISDRPPVKSPENALRAADAGELARGATRRARVSGGGPLGLSPFAGLDRNPAGGETAS